MSAVKQRYRDISPVTLQVAGGAVSSSLYCGEVEGLLGGLVESFLVELYRCKLCQFTCSLKASISSHLLLRHRPPTLTYLEGADGGGGAEDRQEAGLHREASPYQLDLNEDSKQSDEDFLLYNMLDNMSPPTCDISSEGGLQVAHTCEVSTLFEEDSSIFPLKGASVDLSCPIDPPATQEEMAQSAHLMTLGLCRISSAKPPPPTAPPCALRLVQPPPDKSPHLSRHGGLRQSKTGGQVTRTSPCSKLRLPCLLCPLTLPSRRLLDVHVQSHRAGSGFMCVCCSWTADSWEELEPHWRSHCRRRRRREEHKQEKEKKKKKKKKKKVSVAKPFTCPLCPRTFRSIASRNVHQQTHDGCDRRRRSSRSDTWRGQLIGQTGGKEADCTDSQTSRCQPGSLTSVAEKKKRSRRTKTDEEKEDTETGYCCSLCHRKFSTKLTLRRHLGVHGGDKPFTCPHCPYSSRLKASLLQHLRTHTGEKPHRCAECPYASIDRSSLIRHSRTHSQEKPYRCQHCDYSSIQKKSLDLHARRHHTGEAFPCQQCEYSSPDRQLLLRHVRRHHDFSQHATL
ncbi:zinc finger protein 605 [Larimichthys crocea]|uniref:zinc finger protein 605 n=1 Tax=Larimichthys crocea TaxID=215358 RepID=UPI00054C02A0|nr:zinc finger protein 605 [Larimichthys crocea]XP_027144268.1 zinc finger protein 605 [Larimichthys crocea]